MPIFPIRGAGGTPGGVPQFLIGLAMAAGGAYMLTSRVTVSTGWFGFSGGNLFGLSLIPFLAGIALLFFDGRQRWGWMLLFLGVVIIAAGILMNLRIYFEPTSLFETLLMLGLTAGGIGLIARSLR